MKNIYKLLLTFVLLMAADLAGCSAVGNDAYIEGVVVETKTHKPISNAYMIFQWRHERPSMFEGKGEECDHVEVAVTDETGHYRARGFKGDANPPYWWVYKAGYHKSFDPADGYSNQTKMVGLKPIPNNLHEREGELIALLNIQCGIGNSPGNPDLLPVYDAMYKEAVMLDPNNSRESMANPICDDRGVTKFGLAQWGEMKAKGHLCE